jgi:hypothetical protein
MFKLARGAVKVVDSTCTHLPLAGAAVCWHCCDVLSLACGNVSETFELIDQYILQLSCSNFVGHL